ncbi:hypothetical protein FHT72_004554 [Rhizobium sp. BK077]|uniref:hypothetical protein n=1 Tax=unclassified Rhizobium TaxID=2613769 RepID=UPI0016101134|nr:MULTISPECIES: hypothetical protein [unclassified Rhizobium]MBB3300904.1 hypothetical protein [Rhizobium sp. BK112]MBB3370046.1 hypothetical protein [Rhizobium sp. BK077]MBB4180794.1 hypothetical protein [Rhizobium sp. BK109]
MKSPERKIIRHLRINEVSAVDHPAQTGAVVTIMKSAGPGASPPVTFMPTAETETILQKILAAIHGETIQKSNEEYVPMSNQTHYERLTKAYADRHGVSITKAAAKLMEDDREAVAEAYEKDEAEAVARRFAEASRQ